MNRRGALGNLPIDVLALEALAMSYAGTGEYQRALDYIEKSIHIEDKIDDNSKPALLGHLFSRRASFALQMQYKALAMESYQKMVKHGLQASGGQLNAAILAAMDAACDLATQQGFPEVCENYLLDIAKSPNSNDAASFFGQAQILTRLGHYDSARKIHTKILQISSIQKPENSKRAASFSGSALARLDNWANFRSCFGVIVVLGNGMTAIEQMQNPFKDGDIIIKSGGHCASSFLVFRDLLLNPYLPNGKKSIPVQVWRNGQMIDLLISDINLSLTVW